MKNIKQIFIPKLAVSLSLLFLPISLTVYFFVTLYSNRLIVEQDLSYFDIQNGFIRSLVFDNKVSSLFTRASDFAVWGVFAAIILIISWFVGVSRTTAQNHSAVEGFVNFNQDTKSWHSSFVIKIIIKTLLIGLVIYALLLILATLIPGLVTNIGTVLTENTPDAWLQVVLSNFYIWTAEFLAAVCVKAFKHVQL